MGSLELLSYFWSLNTVLLVKIANFDFGVLTYPPITGAIVARANDEDKTIILVIKEQTKTTI